LSFAAADSHPAESRARPALSATIIPTYHSDESGKSHPAVALRLAWGVTDRISPDILVNDRLSIMELKTIEIAKPSADLNVIVGQAHFIKTVEDLYEAIVQAVLAVKFGVAFCEASGPRLVRHTGTDDALEAAAIAAASAIAAGTCLS
jgi:hypothetical protein